MMPLFAAMPPLPPPRHYAAMPCCRCAIIFASALLLLPMPFRHTLPLLRRIFCDATLAADFRRALARHYALR
jgi:hypothetical protein